MPRDHLPEIRPGSNLGGFSRAALVVAVSINGFIKIQ
jgi:hypothetical protein